MESVKMTREEYELLLKMRLNISYLSSEAELMHKLIVDNIDPHQRYCSDCNSSTTDMKNRLYNWFMGNLETIDKLIEKQDEMKKIDEQLENYIKNGKETNT